MSEHRHGAIRINSIDGDAGTAPDAEFCRVENMNLQAEPERTTEKCAGEIIADMTTVDRINPQLTFTVKDHGQIILFDAAECGRGVADIEAYLREVDPDSKKPVAAASLVHDYYEIYNGLFYWTEMVLDLNGSTFNCTVDINFDPNGVPTEPFNLQENIAYPTIAGGHDVFALSKSFLNGTQIPNVRRIRVENEYQFDTDAEEARVTEWREVRAVNDAITRVRVTTSERFNWVPTTGIAHSGTALDGLTGLQVYARKKGYALTAAEHVLWQAESGTAYPVNATGQGANLMVDEFVVDVLKTDYLPNGSLKAGGAGSGLHLVGTAGVAIP